jgi:6-pyruvoyltetrahydropterin/6-carboxytetrahydropterin synthase
MFRLTREVRFAVNASPEPPAGVPTNSYAGFPSVNGLAHYFALDVTVAGKLQPDSHYLLNIKNIDRRVRRLAIPLVEAAVRQRPREFGAGTLLASFDALKDAWPAVKLERLALSLSPFLSIAVHAEERPMTRLSQKFEFAASHRLHNPALSAEANRATFGKCNNPHGHGHNYEVQVTLVGTVGENGLLVDVPAFESVVARTVIDRFDHKNLNVEVPQFAEVIPSVENIAKVIYGLLKAELQTERARLASVTVWETPKTWCEYGE